MSLADVNRLIVSGIERIKNEYLLFVVEQDSGDHQATRTVIQDRRERLDTNSIGIQGVNSLEGKVSGGVILSPILN